MLTYVCVVVFININKQMMLVLSIMRYLAGDETHVKPD